LRSRYPTGDSRTLLRMLYAAVRSFVCAANASRRNMRCVKDHGLRSQCFSLVCLCVSVIVDAPLSPTLSRRVLSVCGVIRLLDAIRSDGSVRWGDADDADDANDADDNAWPDTHSDDIFSCSTLLMNYFRRSRGQRSEGFSSETGAEMDTDR
jgi:hypothetical protein